MASPEIAFPIASRGTALPCAVPSTGRFPALSEGSREKRAVSILLACMEQVPELAVCRNALR